MAKSIRIGEVFKTVGQPTVTYVRRDEGRHEAALANAIETSGQICLITGPSKTGKTTLYKSVIQGLKKDPLIVRCDDSLNVEQFWAKALESLNFGRLVEKQSSGEISSSIVAKIGGKLGWSWLAEASGEMSAELASSMTNSEIRQKILSNPSPLQLVPVLKKLPVVLVVEDFHYLQDTVKKTIFQQWKTFVDEEVSVIVVGTTHHAVDIVAANRDLLGRKCHIDLEKWSKADLARILQQGFEYLKIDVSNRLTDFIAKESAGLPIITQHAAETLFIQRGVSEVKKGQEFSFEQKDATDALHYVATEKLGELEQYYQRLIMGPRKKARKYETYELVLSCFAEEPIKFDLARHEIDARLDTLPISSERKPPAGSVSSTLRALGKYQKKRGINLLEWHEEDRRLYILEPSFLFFLRWREIPRDKGIKTYLSSSLIETIIKQITRESINQSLAGVIK